MSSVSLVEISMRVSEGESNSREGYMYLVGAEKAVIGVVLLPANDYTQLINYSLCRVSL